MGEAYVELRRRGRCMSSALLLLASTSVARAADEPVGTTTDTLFKQNEPPPQQNAPAAEQSQPVVEEQPRPQGPMIAAGVGVYPAGGSIAYRLDIGPTISSSERVDLRLLGVITFATEEAGGVKTYGLSPFITLQYVRTVIARQSGRFALILEGGAGPTFAWIEFPDVPFVPSHTDSEVRPAGRLAGAVEYRANRGFLVGLQPAGVVFAVVDSDVEAAFELAIRVGYQW